MLNLWTCRFSGRRSTLDLRLRRLSYRRTVLNLRSRSFPDRWATLNLRSRRFLNRWLTFKLRSRSLSNWISDAGTLQRAVRFAISLLLFALELSLLLFELTILLPLVLVAMCYRSRRLLLPPAVDLTRARATIVSHLQFFVLRFFGNALNAQRLVEVFSKRRRHWRSAHYDRRVIKFLRDAWRQVDLAAAPR